MRPIQLSKFQSDIPWMVWNSSSAKHSTLLIQGLKNVDNVFPQCKWLYWTDHVVLQMGDAPAFLSAFVVGHHLCKRRFSRWKRCGTSNVSSLLLKTYSGLSWLHHWRKCVWWSLDRNLGCVKSCYSTGFRVKLSSVVWLSFVVFIVVKIGSSQETHTVLSSQVSVASPLSLGILSKMVTPPTPRTRNRSETGARRSLQSIDHQSLLIDKGSSGFSNGFDSCALNKECWVGGCASRSWKDFMYSSSVPNRGSCSYVDTCCMFNWKRVVHCQMQT